VGGRLASVVLLVALSCTVANAGQDQAGGPQTRGESAIAQWANVSGLPAGSQLRIRRLDGQLTDGRLQSVGGDRLTMLSGRMSLDLQRSSIRLIERQAGSRARHDALSGLLIGVGAGLLQGALLVESNRAFWIPALATGWGGIGTSIGALYGRHRPRFVPVYQAP
jgi:hypothetical protein